MNKLSRLVAACLTLSMLSCVDASHRVDTVVSSTLHPSHDSRLARVVTEFHVDTSFQGHEREWMREGVERLNEQSNGEIHVSLVFDSDWNDMESVKRSARQNLILRAAVYSQRVVQMDRESGDARVETLGYTEVDIEHYDIWTPKRIFIVADRVLGHDTFVHSVMHEVLHALGLGHTSRRGTLMYESVSYPPILCLTRDDAIEFTRVYGGSPEDLAYCAGEE